MNKAQYMGILEHQLTRLPISERNELLYEYESHFIFGLQNGKTEEEIAAELGNPYEIASEVLQDRHDLQNHGFRQAPLNYSAHSYAYKKPSSSPVKTTLLTIALGFLTITIVFPLGISLWAVWFAFSVSSVALCTSPLMAVLDYVLYGEFVPAKWYAAIGIMGLGLVFVTAIKPLYNTLLNATSGYWNWMRSTVRGSFNE